MTRFVHSRWLRGIAGGVVAALMATSVALAAPQITFLQAWGSYGGGPGQFSFPAAVVTDVTGNVYVADTYNNRIQMFAGSGAFLSAWGYNSVSQLGYPTGVAVDGAGNVYVADTANHRVQQFTSGGAPLQAWGTFGTGAGQFEGPVGVTVDRFGNIYVADSGNNHVQKFGGGAPWVVYQTISHICAVLCSGSTVLRTNTP
jgi:DNA-binding beta-propeller fold protein YncE